MKVRDSNVSAWVRGQRKMSQLLGAFGLLDFTMLQPVLAWRAFWNLWTVYFFNFPLVLRPRRRRKHRLRLLVCTIALVLSPQRKRCPYQRIELFRQSNACYEHAVRDLGCLLLNKSRDTMSCFAHYSDKFVYRLLGTESSFKTLYSPSYKILLQLYTKMSTVFSWNSYQLLTGLCTVLWVNVSIRKWQRTKPRSNKNWREPIDY
jgi:hypothetical protein